MKNLKQEKLYKQVFYQIRNYIVDQELKFGEKLPTEAEMCEMLGVSRNVLREAVKSLELIGIVKSKPGVGIVVQEYTMDFLYKNMFFGLIVDDRELIKEILEVRKVLELGYSRRAFETITLEDIEILEGIIEKDVEIPFEDQDKEFHMTIFKHLKNKTLNSIFESAWLMDRGVNGLDTLTDSHDELIRNHTMIIDALKEKDIEKFIKALEYHFSSGLYIERGINRRNK